MFTEKHINKAYADYSQLFKYGRVVLFVDATIAAIELQYGIRSIQYSDYKIWPDTQKSARRKWIIGIHDESIEFAQFESAVLAKYDELEIVQKQPIGLQHGGRDDVKKLVLSQASFFTRQSIAREADTTDSTAGSVIRQLMEEGLVKHIGATPGHHGQKRYVTVANWDKSEVPRSDREIIMDYFIENGPATWREVSQGLPTMNFRTVQWQVGRLRDNGFLEPIGKKGGKKTIYAVAQDEVKAA